VVTKRSDSCTASVWHLVVILLFDFKASYLSLLSQDA